MLPPWRPKLRWGVVSVVAHVVIVTAAAVSMGPGFFREREREPVLIQLLPLQPDEQRQFDLPPLEDSLAALPIAADTVRTLARVPTRAPEPDTLPPIATTIAPRVVPIGIPRESPRDSAMVISTHRTVGPTYGHGRVWVRPVEAELGVVGPSSSVAVHYARVDSAVRARIIAFIDTLPRDSFATPDLPKWTTKIGESTWGIDENWIYLGDIKLPSALLALIPFPQGNYEESKRNQELARIRDIIIQAENRADNSADFKRYIRELRARRDQEREAERARKAARDTVIP